MGQALTRVCLSCFQIRPAMEITMNICKSEPCVKERTERWQYAKRRARPTRREYDPEQHGYLRLVKK